MDLLRFALRKLLAGIPLLLGVTLLSFTLMVYFGPDKTFELLGKNPTVEQIAEVPGFGGKAAAELKAFLTARSTDEPDGGQGDTPAAPPAMTP